jgi:hypothetical protein
MDDLAAEFIKSQQESTGKVHHSKGGNQSVCDISDGAPKELPGINFSAIMLFIDDENNAHTVLNLYPDSGLTGLKIPGGGAQEPILQDNVFQATVEQMMLAIGYSRKSIEEALKMIEVWNEDDRVSNRQIIRASFMEYLEETHCVPDLMNVVCHAHTKNARGERLMIFVKARASYMNTKNGLERITDLSKVQSTKSKLDKKVIDTVCPIPTARLRDELSSKAHKAVVNRLLDYTRPTA